MTINAPRRSMSPSDGVKIPRDIMLTRDDVEQLKNSIIRIADSNLLLIERLGVTIDEHSRTRRNVVFAVALNFVVLGAMLGIAEVRTRQVFEAVMQARDSAARTGSAVSVAMAAVGKSAVAVGAGVEAAATGGQDAVRRALESSDEVVRAAESAKAVAEQLASDAGPATAPR